MSDFTENRPQRLCLMCGKCCIAVINKPYNELLELAKCDKNTKEFLSLFEPYESTKNGNSLYKCKHLKNNLCNIYEDRPERCRKYPETPFTNVPSGCGFEGWLFQKREELKARIRREKEILVSLETELKITKDLKKADELKKEINEIKDSVQKYSEFGSDNW